MVGEGVRVGAAMGRPFGVETLASGSEARPEIIVISEKIISEMYRTHTFERSQKQ